MSKRPNPSGPDGPKDLSKTARLEAELADSLVSLRPLTYTDQQRDIAEAIESFFSIPLTSRPRNEQSHADEGEQEQEGQPNPVEELGTDIQSSSCPTCYASSRAKARSIVPVSTQMAQDPSPTTTLDDHSGPRAVVSQSSTTLEGDYANNLMRNASTHSLEVDNPGDQEKSGSKNDQRPNERGEHLDIEREIIVIEDTPPPETVPEEHSGVQEGSITTADDKQCKFPTFTMADLDDIKQGGLTAQSVAIRFASTGINFEDIHVVQGWPAVTALDPSFSSRFSTLCIGSPVLRLWKLRGFLTLDLGQKRKTLAEIKDFLTQFDPETLCLSAYPIRKAHSDEVIALQTQAAVVYEKMFALVDMHWERLRGTIVHFSALSLPLTVSDSCGSAADELDHMVNRSRKETLNVGTEDGVATGVEVPSMVPLKEDMSGRIMQVHRRILIPAPGLREAIRREVSRGGPGVFEEPKMQRCDSLYMVELAKYAQTYGCLYSACCGRT